MPGGRPRKYTKKKLREIAKQIEAYTERTAVPILAECAYELRISRQKLYEFPELNDAIKNLIAKKEYQLEKGALLGKLTTSMAIFSLKQLGWRDKPKEEDADSLEKFKNAMKDLLGD